MISTYQTIGDNQNMETQNIIRGNAFDDNNWSLKFQEAMGIKNTDMQEAVSSDVLFSELFTALDLQREEIVKAPELYMATKTMGWRDEQVKELIHEMDPDHGEDFPFQEFMLIMKYIE